LVAALAGCRPQQPFYFHEDGDLSHYVDKATDIEYPDVQSETLDDVNGAVPPLTLDNPDPKEIWELSLEEAVRIGLENGKVFRSMPAAIGQIIMPDTVLFTNPDFAPSFYDPARTETNGRFGVEAVLAAFDAQFSTSVFWNKNDTPQNVAGFVEAFRPRVFQQDLGTFQAQLAKTNATGGTWSLTHNVKYELNNATLSREWPSDWNVNLEAGFRQPLLQGAGVNFNRIAGPGAIPGFYNGVMLARTDVDIQLAALEGNVRDFLFDLEKSYWNLYWAYRFLDAVIAGRDSALQTWRQVRAKYETGSRGGSAQEEAQARQQYFAFRANMEQALSQLYGAESNLRYMMGIASTDGRLIRPKDEPTLGKVDFDWYDVHAEALTRSPDLRQQKWKVKKAELTLIAAKNFLLPRLDAVGTYRWLGLGNDLLDPTNAEPNAYGSMTSGHFQEWELGLNLNIPLGFRKEMAAVRNAQLEVARERTVLQEQELELSHQVAWVMRELDKDHTVSQTQFNRLAAAETEVKAVTAAYEGGTATLDLVLDAQQRRAQTAVEFYTAVVNYMVDISHLHFRKGSLLEYNGVYLAEGPWPAKAYFDALRRARARDASLYLDYGFTYPRVVSRGPVAQHAGKDLLPVPEELEPMAGGVTEGTAPLEPTPAEAPAAPGTSVGPGAAQPEAVPPPPPGAAQPGAGPVESPIADPQAAWKPFDLGRLNLISLSGKPDQRGQAPVAPASFEQPLPGADRPQTTPDAQWQSTSRPTNRYEPRPNPPPAEADRSASSWKGIQH